MSRRMRAAALAAIMTVGAFLAGCGQDELAALPGWDSDYEKAKARAADEHKPLAVLFTAAWSDAARIFERKALSDPRVTSLLDGYVRVRLDLDTNQKTALALEATDRNGYSAVPWLVLVSPEGERKSVAGQCEADDLAGFLGTLGPWQPLPGWEADPAGAEKLSRESGKPLAVLYSAAWDPEAVAFERGALADERVKAALAGFTLLRLNIAADKQRAKADFEGARNDYTQAVDGGERRKFYLAESAPALYLPAPDGKRAMVPLECSAAGLLCMLANLGGWRQAEGWGSDYEAAKQQAKAEGKPLAVVLDSADWPGAKFLGMILGSDDAREALKAFVVVRLEHGKASVDVRNWGAQASPSLVLFDRKGKHYGTYGFKGGPSEPASSAADRIAEGLRSLAEAKGK